MAVAITTISPGRGRPADVITINGFGFSTTLAQNLVSIGGFSAGVNSATATALVVVVPVGLAVDQHVLVTVTNLDDVTQSTSRWWSKDTIANTALQILRTKIPFTSEILRGLGRDVKNMNTFEARFHERLAAKIELVPDVLDAVGNFFSKAAAPLGIRQALAGTAGQPFVSNPIGGKFQDRQCWTLTWGKTITAASLVETMNAGEIDDSGATIQTLEVAPVTGQIALVSLRERVSVSSRVIQVEVLIDGLVVKTLKNGDDEFSGPGFRQGELTFYPGLAVTQGQTIEIRITRNNVTTQCNVLAYVLVV